MASVYVDHQAEIGFPVGYVIRNLDFCDGIFLFGSDEANTLLLENIRKTSPLSEKIKCVSIGQKISRPEDIATGQNKCVDWLKENSPSDYILVLQADLTLRRRGVQYLNEFMASGQNSRPVVQLSITQSMLHTYSDQTYFGCALIGRESDKCRFIHDGAYTEACWISSYLPDPAHAFHVGWLGAELCYGHFKRHSKTFDLGHMSPEAKEMGEIAAMFSRDREGFIRRALVLNRNRNHKPLTVLPIDDEDYAEAVSFFKLSEERNMVIRLAKDVEGGMQ